LPKIHLVNHRVFLNLKTSTTRPSLKALPASLDWQALGRVTNVSNQGQCGSCWAFATVAAIESLYLIATNGALKLNLSEQALMDCDTTQFGCGGGWPFPIMRSGGFGARQGITLESSNPYQAVKKVCSNPDIRFPIVNALPGGPYYEYIGGIETKLIELLQKGPAVVAVYASKNFQSYKSGILNDTLCVGKDDTYLNHAGESLNQSVIL
jgi:hypothetical protein